MAGGCAWSRRLTSRTRTLRGLLRDTQRALHDVYDILHIDPEISIAVQEISNLSARPTVLVLLGTNSQARARLLHSLLGRQLLPDTLPRGCRWLRFQFGITTQVHLSLGNSEFELVEELECNRRPWETLPVEDLIRQDHTDLATMLEVELNNPFLKDGLRILIPPDLDCDPGEANLQTLKQLHSELYTKRELILKGYNPVYLYAIDKIGENVFSDNCVPYSIVKTRSEEDFWNNFNFYSMARTDNSDVHCDTHKCNEVPVENGPWKKIRGEKAVLTAENCLDLYQLKELNPHAQVLFVLFSDSNDISRRRELIRVCVEATESTEDAVYSVEELPESDQELVQTVMSESDGIHNKCSRENIRLNEEQTAFMSELLDQWELMSSPPPKHYAKSQSLIIDDMEIIRTSDQNSQLYVTNTILNDKDMSKREGDSDGVVKNRIALLNRVLKFATDCLQTYLLEYCVRLSEVHVKLLQHFILASFDLARELQIVPKKIQYVASQEQQLYENIREKFSEGDKKHELVQIMQEVLQEMKSEVNNMDWSVDDLPYHQDQRFVVSNSTFYSTELPQLASSNASDGEDAMSYDSYNFDDYDIIDSNHDSFADSDSYRNTVKRAEEGVAPASIRVENEGSGGDWASCGGGRPRLSHKHASLLVQRTVLARLSRKISLKLVDFVDCLKDTYFGTLQRCLEALEACCRPRADGQRASASAAARQLLAAARRVDLQPAAAYSLLHSLADALRALLYRLRITGSEADEACCVLSPAWRRQVAIQTTNSLSPQRLAKVISAQILERLSVAHERYQSALTSLETVLGNRLHHTEDIKLAIRKKYAPSFARLCLESTSMCDLLMYGTPELGREIGRGQYGVVYAGRGSWAGHSPIAIKSVLPADDRHYHELAMEFFYTRSIPAHPRVVRLVGSLVQRAPAAAPPAVLLLAARYERDLHAALRAGLPRAARMRVACDIVEGLRYLHSLGLVHRDVKMKNVLLDAAQRAALADLGFCAASALISGSVVGTPVHMAPDLLAGAYHAAVDVYAFGILYWYVCAGNVKLPSAFEMFQNKEQLWSKVKKGLRPERLPHFTDECWEIMEACWASEPSERAHLGDIQPKLEKILEESLKTEFSEPCSENNAVYDVSDDDSLDMTGMERNGV